MKKLLATLGLLSLLASPSFAEPVRNHQRVIFETNSGKMQEMSIDRAERLQANRWGHIVAPIVDPGRVYNPTTYVYPVRDTPQGTWPASPYPYLRYNHY